MSSGSINIFHLLICTAVGCCNLQHKNGHIWPNIEDTVILRPLLYGELFEKNRFLLLSNATIHFLM